MTDTQSVCLGVEPHLGLMTRYLFWLKVTVLSIWGALSDKRSGLSFDCLDISVPLINPQSYEPGESCVASGHCVYRHYLGNEHAAMWHHRSLLCSSAQCGSARHGTEQTPLPPPPHSVYSVARRLADRYLAALCCVIQRWVDMSEYILISCWI
jgi:hypothetical protein